MANLIRILFVCDKNVALSQMAAQIFIHIARKRKIIEHFEINSAAVSDDAEIGLEMLPNVRDFLTNVGVDSGSHRSIKLVAEDYEKYDWIICMTEANRRKCYDIFKGNAVYVTPKDVRRVFKTDPASPISLNGMVKARICCLMDFTGVSRDILEPNISKEYRFAFNEIKQGCLSLISLTPFSMFY